MRHLSGVPDLAVEFAFRELHGAETMLARHGAVSRLEPEGFREAARRADLIAVIDTAEYLDAVHDLEVPVLLEVHTTTDRGLAYLEGRSALGDRVLVPSEASARLLRARFGLEARVEVVGNVVDGDVFTPGPPDGALPGRPILGWVGKLDAHKNWEAFLELGALLVQEGADVELWMVGGSTAHPPAVRGLLETSAALELSDRLRWLPRVPYAGMPGFHRAVAASGGVVVSTTKNESFGMSVAEALLSGAPVVAPRVGALPELAPEDAPYLALHPPGDIARATRSVAALLGPERAAATGLLALDRPRLAEAWSPAAVGARYLEVLRDLAGR
jgi:glycosyltransferase involved in cell wall biosynthesis